ARRWWRRHGTQPRLRRGVAIVADGVESLRRLLDRAGRRADHGPDDRDATTGGSIHTRSPGTARIPQRVAFVYPGLGNVFEGMGRELSLLWPEVLRAQDAENRRLRDQFEPAVWWGGPLPEVFADHRVPILGQVALGSLVTDILRGLGVVPDAAIGYSLGESAALVALRAWTDRDELHQRLRSSPLFQAELAGPCHAARRVWGIPAGEPVDWVAGIVPRPADEVRTAIAGRGRVYVLIQNTAEETVVGGSRRSVDEVVGVLRCPFLELPVVSTVHCPIGRAVVAEYRALHDLETRAPAGITVYSGVWGRPYALDRRSATEAITAQATQPIDFPAVIERAYLEDVGVFLEVGPGSSCTRLIDRILGTRPHLARSACRPDRDPLAAILEILGECIAHRLPVDLTRLYGGRTDPDAATPDGSGPLADVRQATVDVDVSWGDFVLPAPPRPNSRVTASVSTMQQRQTPAPAATTIRPGSPVILPWEVRGAGPPGRSERSGGGLPSTAPSSWIDRLSATEHARTEAHRAFLRVAEGTVDLIGRLTALQLELIEGSRAAAADVEPDDDRQAAAVPGEPPSIPRSPAALFDRWQCFQLAVGSVAAVLGPDFQEVDRLPTRVRLPDEPLMLVDRILSLEGRPQSLQGGRIVTEHDIQPGAWYLDHGRAAPCIVMEAGQADLVLSGYLGVDSVTQGLAVYRLLDATVTFHRGLPGAGAVLRYDIRITGFFRQGTTILFRFEFDATLAGEPMLTMREGCAGFFTPEELASGKGIVSHTLEGRSRPELRISPGAALIPTAPGCLDERQVEALRRGDLASAFGPPFDRLSGEGMIGLPGGRMALIHRVSTLDPNGGPAGLGLIRGEADIHPGDWFMVCHFLDDRVMPGTLMYECCLHTLRVFLMRLGWVGRSDRVAFEPVPGIANRLKCRGQITEATRVVVYEVAIKERGYRPEPYAIADALILADGKPIVAVFDLALQLTGTSREDLERIWQGCRSGEER
ncbi:MAG TPA: type I polyketide synthase, partial [Isosphaeraceae bacterium]|nr:type I polyketide synthase [Isosphaeraceae bacterium]